MESSIIRKEDKSNTQKDRVPIRKAISQNKKRLDSASRIMIQSRNDISFVKVNTIMLIVAAKDYTEVFINNGRKLIVHKTMDEWDFRLPNYEFCRVHRSFIVNFNYIEKCMRSSPNTAIIVMRDISITVRVSRYYFQKLKLIYS